MFCGRRARPLRRRNDRATAAAVRRGRSGGNMQRWRFLGITDPDVKQAVGTYYKRAWDEVVYPRYSAGDPAPGTSPERSRRMLDVAQYLADQIHEAPVWIVPCLAGAYPFRTAGSSIYPAVQNILLAARALGLGATPATLYPRAEGGAPEPCRRHCPAQASWPHRTARREALRHAVGDAFGQSATRRYRPEANDCYRNPIDNQGIAAMIKSEMTSAPM